MDDLVSDHASSFLRDDCGADTPQPPSSVLRDDPLHRVFKAAHNVYRHHALQQMRAEGIDTLFPGAAPLLLHLGDEDGLPISELARRCELENSTLTPLVDDMERHGLVTRIRASEDRRVIRIFLTESGRALEPRLRAVMLRLQKIALAGISDQEVAILHGIMNRIVANLQQDTPK